MKKILVLGAVPPPWEGMAVANKNVLDSPLIKTKFKLMHYDTRINIVFTTISKISLIKLFKLSYLYLVYPVYLEKHKPDILYMALSGSRKGILRDVPFILIAKLFGLKIIIHYHASFYSRLFNEDRHFFKKVARLALICVNRHIVLGENLKGMFSGLDIPEDRISVVENGIEDSFNMSDTITKGKGIFKILYLSNLMRTKGFIDVLESIPYLLKKIKKEALAIKPIFLFIGAFKSKKERLDSENFVYVNRINSYVKFHGVVIGQDKYKILEESNIFVLPSYSEGQPFSLIEALCYGLPVIVTKVGCMAEMIKDGVNGYFIPVKSPEAIAEKIFLLMNAPDLTKQMVENNRHLFKERFLYEKFESNMANLFQEVTRLHIC